LFPVADKNNEPDPHQGDQKHDPPETPLRKLRRASGLTQHEVAERIGITQRKYQSYEAGEYEMRPDVIISLARLFKVDVGAIMGVLPDRVPIVGRVVNDGCIAWKTPDEAPEFAPVPPEVSMATKALRVVHNGAAGLAPDKWLIYYDDVRVIPDTHLSHHVVVFPPENNLEHLAEACVGRLFRGETWGKFDFVTCGGTLFRNTVIKEVCPVTFLKPEY
jgi:transcriptional regulator with XRE-family HTH domain